MTLDILRWLRGYVEFSVTGSAERLYNRCARKGLRLWNMKSGEQPGACISAVAYRRLRPCVYRSGCKVRVRRRVGLPFRLAWTRKRRGLVAGAVLFLLILWMLNQRVWSIRITGNETLSTQRILAALSEIGLEPGAKKADVVPLSIEQQLMLRFPEIGWVSVNNATSVVEVQMTEGVKKPSSLPETPSNMKSAATGQVLRIECFAGTPLVKPGDAVVQGQLLISGVTETVHEGDRLCHAAGRVIAETYRTFTAEAPMSKTVTEYTGREVLRKSLNFYGLVIPLTVTGKPEGSYACTGNTQVMGLWGVPLPVSFYQEVWREQVSHQEPLTVQEGQTAARASMEKLLAQELKDAVIKERQESFQEQNGMMRMTLSIRSEEDLCRESPIFIN